MKKLILAIIFIACAFTTNAQYTENREIISHYRGSLTTSGAIMMGVDTKTTFLIMWSKGYINVNSVRYAIYDLVFSDCGNAVYKCKLNNQLYDIIIASAAREVIIEKYYYFGYAKRITNRIVYMKIE